MTEYADPSKIQNIILLGFERMKHFRKVRAMMFKSYVSHYYRDTEGLEGDEPLNLVFNTIRSYVPNLVMQNPLTEVVSKFTVYDNSAELLGLALDDDAKQTGMKSELRAWVTNALFGWGIMKVGISAHGELVQFDDVLVDPGQVYALNVGLDDFGFDPTCTNIRNAKMLFHRTTVSRKLLLDIGDYDKDVVMALPTSPTNMCDRLSSMTVSTEAKSAMATLQDEVDIVEAYFPEIETVVTMGDPEQKIHDKYLKIADFNGPKEGPYVFLSFAPPVEGNPFPVAPVSIWYDLAVETNRVFKKILEQIHQQKDVGLYTPGQSDSVELIEDARTGDWIPAMDPKGINVVSMGGQNQKNEAAILQLQTWYNYMSGNPDQISGNIAPGSGGGRETATKTQTLQSNASIGIEDMRDILYDQTAEIQRRKAWYFWTDPLINKPLTKRGTGGQRVQLFLTPEQRQGDFIHYAFRIVERSMSRLDPMLRSKRIETFCTNILPAAANTAMIMMQIGQPFNVAEYLTMVATDWDILEHVKGMFNDPEFAQKMQLYMLMGSKDTGQASMSPEGAAQNKGNPMARSVNTQTQDFHAQAQDTAAQAQSINQGVY